MSTRLLAYYSDEELCSIEIFLNRACAYFLVGMTPRISPGLVWLHQATVLEWCGNYLTDQVLQQSAAGTVFKLMATTRLCVLDSVPLCNREKLVEQAHREAGSSRDPTRMNGILFRIQIVESDLL
jgi:hypothetical protein